MQSVLTTQLTFTKPFNEAENQVLSPESIDFLEDLVVEFSDRRKKLLEERVDWQKKIDDGALPDFISETISIRNGDWKI
ncbi:malate synthase A, partial [Xenorhabdus bovienii]|nr:malate synthase A [Xenorhabdus bovienii]